MDKHRCMNIVGLAPVALVHREQSSVCLDRLGAARDRRLHVIFVFDIYWFVDLRKPTLYLWSYKL